MMMTAPSLKISLKYWCRGVALALPVALAQALLPAVCDTGFGVAQAQEKKAEEKPQTKRTQALNNKVYEQLQAAQEAAEAKKYNEALGILNGMTSGGKTLNGYETANVYTMYGFIYYSQENYDKALESYRKVIAQTDIPEGMVTSTKFTIAQLYFVTERYKEGVAALEDWFKTAQNPGSDAYILMGQGYYQLQNFDKALVNVEKGINMYKEKGKVPKENWYSLQRFLHYEKNNYKKVVEILNEMLVHYPKKAYWLQLSGMYGELKDESKQLYAMETAYVQGMLESDRELLNMAYLFLGADLPYKAAKVLDTGMKAKVIPADSKNLELLGNAWRSAQELAKAIPEMERAAQQSDQGELWARLGNIYLDNDEYDKAVKAVNAGLKKGGVKRADTAQLVLGMAHYNLKQYDSARRAFEQAMKDKRSENYAKQWIAHMDKELERQKQIEAG